jgi:hypothetical protein
MTRARSITERAIRVTMGTARSLGSLLNGRINRLQMDIACRARASKIGQRDDAISITSRPILANLGNSYAEAARHETASHSS